MDFSWEQTFDHFNIFSRDFGNIVLATMDILSIIENGSRQISALITRADHKLSFMSDNCSQSLMAKSLLDNAHVNKLAVSNEMTKIEPVVQTISNNCACCCVCDDIGNVKCMKTESNFVKVPKSKRRKNRYRKRNGWSNKKPEQKDDTKKFDENSKENNKNVNKSSKEIDIEELIRKKVEEILTFKIQNKH